jgi:hypothetical protein
MRWQARSCCREQAATLFDQGTQARRLADAYVRLTVTLATVLLLTAIGHSGFLPREVVW